MIASFSVLNSHHRISAVQQNRTVAAVDSVPERMPGSIAERPVAAMEDVLRADYGDAAQKAVNDAARAKSKPSNAVSGPRYPQSPSQPLPNLHLFLFRESRQSRWAYP